MRRRHSGFTLLEVLIGLAILGMAGSVIFGGMSAAVKGVRRIDDTERRIELARRKLAETELLDNFQVGDTAAGQFNDGTLWRLNTSWFIPPTEGTYANAGSMIRVSLVLQWQSGQTPKSWTIDTYRFVPAASRPPERLESQLDEIR
jgi:prepilin-type N-terminal cleavage/methylation domain-containing protein